MEDGRIKDSQLSASSSLRYELGPQRARLYSNVPDGSWIAGHNVAGQEYLQIDLLSSHVITHVATQGREYRYHQWVTKYYLKYEYRGEIWKSYRYGRIVKEFKGNVDKKSVVTNKLPSPIKTSAIRFVALEWHLYIALRVELYGCTAN
ncbi:Neuropilin-2 [Exaiptasia diaphana]|nr:Neuropilin-2 [Exaiptasia diaphana]